MKKIIFTFLIMSFVSLNIAWSVLASDKPEDVFYSSLSENGEQVYKEYQNATLNIRGKLHGSELQELDKELGKYYFGSFAEYPNDDIYFFASIYEDKHIIVKKYAIYELNGKFVNGGVNRNAKKEVVISGEFKGWEHSVGLDELSKESPTK